MNLAVMQREAAKAAAEHFRSNLLLRIGMVLEDHSSTLVDFICETQRRIEAAEDLLGSVAACTRSDPNRKSPDSTPTKGKWRTVNVPTATMEAIDALLASAKARNDGNDN